LKLLYWGCWRLAYPAPWPQRPQRHPTPSGSSAAPRVQV
jgi:hypothetical protein